MTTDPCANPKEIENGYVSHTYSFDGGRFGNDGWQHQELIEYKCFRHYALADSYQARCNNGEWEGYPDKNAYPRCEYSLATEGKFGTMSEDVQNVE